MSAQTDLPIIAFSTGDPAGIGPELCMKTALSKSVSEVCRPVMIGDPTVLARQQESCAIEIDFDGYEDIADIDWAAPGVKILMRHQFDTNPYVPGEVSAEAGHAMIDSVNTAVKLALAGEVAAVVSAPQNETSIHQAGIEFDGHPSHIARLAGLAPDDVYLMLCFDHIKIAHCTLHRSVRRAVEMITQARIEHTIETVHKTLAQIGTSDPLIMVSGLNPHAGEGGLFGEEETEFILPAIETMRDKGIRLEGPIPADLMLHRTDVDAFVVMLHDQGHIPAKVVAPYRTAAMAIGSPILFSSVAHGSGHDIVGKGIADPSAMIEAVRRLTGRNAPRTVA